jgi:thioredoxin-dependent peroxiredoxin
MNDERTGEAFELNEKLVVLGPKLEAGQKAPDFVLDEMVGDSIRQVRLSDSSGSVRLISTINSLDTPVCDVETRRWDELLGDLPAGVVVFTISMDLPFAQARWRGSEAGHAVLSAHRSEQFGRDYGVLIREWRLLQRAIFVIDGGGGISYAEYVADQMAQPDYERAVDAVRAQAG